MATEIELEKYRQNATTFLNSAASSDIEMTQENLNAITREATLLGATIISDSFFFAGMAAARGKGLLTLKPQPVPVMVPVIPEPTPEPQRGPAIEFECVRPSGRASFADLAAAAAKRTSDFRADQKARRDAVAQAHRAEAQTAAESVTLFYPSGKIDHPRTALAREKARSKR